MSKGQLVIQALESIVRAGLGADGLPKLAICRADATTCHLRIGNGEVEFRPRDAGWRSPAGTISIPFDRLPANPRDRRFAHEALLPHVPFHLRPKHALSNYHVLWEATWEPVPTKDPYLLRRIGISDMWVVMAMWGLTEVERAALATRIRPSP